MLFTLFTVALFVAANIPGISAFFAVNSPKLVQCQTSKISWEPTGSPPYTVAVVRAEDMCGPALFDIGDFTTTITYWQAKLRAGTKVYISVMDSKDEEAWSSLITVGDSNDTSCLTGSGSPSGSPPTGTSPSPSPSPTTSVAPLGAANAGLGGSIVGAATARQASLPVLALAGLAVVLALL